MSSNPSEYDETVTVDTDDDRVEGHTFEKGYEAHDIAEAHVTRHLEHMGFTVQSWGIDMREDKGVLSDDKMDLKVYKNGAEHDRDGTVETTSMICALLEVKTKRNEDWYGTINRHHFRKYLRQAHAHEVPAYVYMSLLNEDEEQIVRDTFIPIEPWDELTAVMDGEYEYYTPESVDQFLVEQVDNHPQINRTWRAPDGNQVVDLDIETGIDWTELTYELSSE